MSFDFSTLITDRTYADVSRVQELASKIRSGTASESELTEFNSAAMKGAYNYTDLNRVTAAMEALKSKLEGYGYAVPGYQRIKVPHVLPEPEPTSRLPEGYLELTYIESTGTQYIDTGFKPNQDSRIDMVAQLTGTVGENNMLFGTRSSGTTEFFVYYHTAGNYYGRYVSSTLQVSKTFGSKVSVSLNKNTFTLDGSSVSTTYSAFQCTTNAVLFAWNNTGTISDKSAMKLYSCQIYDNGTLVRDYIPCINPNGVVGLYDLVTESFFGNSGTGSFVAGAIPRELPDGYTQVEYIKATGTQYIDTGFSPNQDTRVVCDCEYEATSAASWLFGVRVASGSGAFAFLAYSSKFRTDYGSSYELYFATTITKATSVDKNKNVTTVNGSVTLTDATATFSSKYNLALLAINTAGTISGYSKAKIKSCQIYDNGTLVRDYVPCKNVSGVFGLYDLANDVFYQNAGTGTFVAGEEVVAPATASVMVVSDDVTEYDPYTWYEFDWPTPATMTIYLLNVSAIRAVLAVLRSTPEVPADIERMMTRDANDIEAILLDVYRQLTIMPTTFIPCGEALCGGDNL